MADKRDPESTPLEQPDAARPGQTIGEPITGPADVRWLLFGMPRPAPGQPAPKWSAQVIGPRAAEVFQTAEAMTAGGKWGAVAVLLATVPTGDYPDKCPRIVVAQVWRRKGEFPEIGDETHTAPKGDELLDAAADVVIGNTGPEVNGNETPKA